MIKYDAFVLWILDSEGDWRDVDVSFSEDALHEVAGDVISNDSDTYPSGAYRLDKVAFVTVEHGDSLNVKNGDF